MTKKLFLFPILLLFLTGCPKKEDLKNMDSNELNRLEACIQEKRSQNLPIDDCSKKLQKSSPTSNQIKPIKTHSNKRSDLEKLDDCIALQKKKNLPVSNCTNKLKK